MPIKLENDGEPLTLPQEQIMLTLMTAFNLMLERESVYGSAWTRYGVGDKVMHCRDIMSRVEHLSTVVTEPDAKLEDLFLDLVNYAAMGALQVRQGKFS